MVTLEDLRFSLPEDILGELELYIDASKEYYTDEAIMSDAQFDELTETLKSYGIKDLTDFIDKTIYREENAAGEPGMDMVEQYTQEMISLLKIKYKDKSSVSEIKKFFIGVRQQKKRGPKLDGAALKITWEFPENVKPYVKQILSRGGLDVTDMFKDHWDIQDTVKFRQNIIAGELVINKKLFAEKYSSEAGGDYENPRNFVGKLLKQKSISEEIHNDLRFVACTNGINPLPNHVWTDFEDKDFYELEDLVKFLKSDDFPYLCDGIVIAYDEEGERRVKDNYPLNMVAIKFPASRAKTKVIGFSWSQKKSGKLTPKCLIQPVKLDGSTCTCANGYNYENLLNAHIGIGSEIEIEKSGDIIPVVAKVLTRSTEITMPDCDYRREGKHLVAMDLEESRRYKFTLGIKTLQLDGIGPTISENVGEIVDFDIIELFNPKYKPDICSKLGAGSNWMKFSELYNIKTFYLDKLIALLQFNGVGPKMALKVSLLISKKSSDTSNMSSHVLQNVCRGEGFKLIIESIGKLKALGINVLNPIEVNEDTISFEMTTEPGTSIVIDGETISKSDFTKRFSKLYPNAVHSTLTKDTTYLFTNNLSSNTGKINKARKYNVKIVLYSEALKNNFK